MQSLYEPLVNILTIIFSKSYVLISNFPAFKIYVNRFSLNSGDDNIL